MKKYDVTHDPIFLNHLAINQIENAKTIKGYKVILNQYCEYYQKTLTELIDEARHEQKTINDIIERTLYNKLLEFHNYLKLDLQNGTNTIESKMSRIRSVYSYQYIQLPIKHKRKKIKRKDNLTTKDLLTKNEIREAVESRKELSHKLLILFLFTTGMRVGDAKDLKLKDFIKATIEYHNEEDIYKIIEILKKQQDVIPCWDFWSEKSDIHTITFNTPEVTKMILTYLSNRKDKLTPESYLFTGYNTAKPVGLSYQHYVFSQANKYLYDNGFIEYEKLNNGYYVFHAHGMREMFKTILTNHEINYYISKKMMGQVYTKVDTAYTKVDKETCKRAYLRVLKEFSLSDVETNIIDDAGTKKLHQVEKELAEMKKLFTPDTIKIMKKMINNK